MGETLETVMGDYTVQVLDISELSKSFDTVLDTFDPAASVLRESIAKMPACLSCEFEFRFDLSEDYKLLFLLIEYQSCEVEPDPRVLQLARHGKYRIRRKNLNRLRFELKRKFLKRLEVCGW